MKESPAVPILIGAILGIATVVGTGFYFVLFGFLPGSPVARILLVLIALLLLGALGAVIRQRVRELKKEDTNDYRNY